MVETTIEETKDLPQFTLEELIGSLVSHEDQFNQEEESLINSLNTQYYLNRA